MNGWRVVIISDQIIVRSYNGSDAWKPSMELSVPSSIIAAMSGVPAAGLPVPHIAGVPTTPQEPMPGVVSFKLCLVCSM